jgi:hypothetical protein
MSTVSNAASVFSPSQINTTSSSSSSSTSSTAQAAGANASQQLAGNFNTFLQLLITQDCFIGLTLNRTIILSYTGHGRSCI